MAKDLTNTIKVGNEEFNVNAVNAVNAENAGKLDNALSFARTQVQDNVYDEDFLVFDGQTAKTLNIVPTAGGRFDGRITVPKLEDLSENKSPADILKDDGETVVNYSDIKSFIVDSLLNNAILYTWNGSGWDTNDDEGNIRCISIVLGPSGQANVFAKTNHDNYNAGNRHLAAFIYVSNDGDQMGNISLGLAQYDEVVGIQVTADSANTANKLATGRVFSVNLANTNSVTFDGTANAPLGVTGVLPITRGGTGATNEVDAVANLKLATVASTGEYRDILHRPYFAGSTSEGGAANSATKATQDADGKEISKNYYRSASNTTNKNSITISTSSPSGGSNGDIWIVYS